MATRLSSDAVDKALERIRRMTQEDWVSADDLARAVREADSVWKDRHAFRDACLQVIAEGISRELIRLGDLSPTGEFSEWQQPLESTMQRVSQLWEAQAQPPANKFWIDSVEYGTSTRSHGRH